MGGSLLKLALESLGSFLQTAKCKSHPKPSKLNTEEPRLFQAPHVTLRATNVESCPRFIDSSYFSLKSKVKTPKRKTEYSFGMSPKSREITDSSENVSNS